VAATWLVLDVHVTVAALAPLPLVPQLLLQLVMSSSTVDPYCPTGQVSQAVALENGFKVGCAMNVPGEQHPKRPVDPYMLNGFKVCHLPPHNVRLKPL